MSRALSEHTPTLAGAVRPHRAARPRRRSRVRVPYGYLVPGFVLLLALLYVPMALAGWVSLTSLSQYTIGHWLTAPFVALRNFVNTLNPSNALGQSFLSSIRASAEFAAMSTAVAAPIGVAVALLLNSPLKARGVLRALYLIPYVMPLFVTGLVWRLIFQNKWGGLDTLLRLLHLGHGTTYWLLGADSFWSLLIAEVWSAWPFVYLMTLGALQSIPVELHESAKLDGAGWWQRFRYVTLPTLWPSLSLALLFSTINHLNNFTLPYVMFGQSPPPDVNVMPLTIYTQSFGLFNLGLGAAMSIISMVVMLIPAVFYIRGMSRQERR
jgi:multiple sugar transport system permease protein